MQVVRALMRQIIDYAGLFPPAKLDMSPAVRNYAAYRDGPHAWALARFIVPVARLAEFEEAARDLLPTDDNAPPWALSALTSPADDADALERDLETIATFNHMHMTPANGLAEIDAIELRASSSSAIDQATEAIPDHIAAFFELPLDRDLRGMVAAIAGTGACAKARTGGITPDLFPSPDRLASFITTCAAAEVPFKATAGLHHPRTHPSIGVPGATEFGFVNVFVGAALAQRDAIDSPKLAALLADENTESFTFKDAHINWREHTVTVDHMTTMRDTFGLSYGSCSFEEPIDDLQSLKLL